jgi:hypothetical protein
VTESADAPPIDDGFEHSLRRARAACMAMLFAPPLLTAIVVGSISRGGSPHEEPIIVAALALVGLTVMCSPGLVREELARKAIGRRLAADSGSSDGPESVYRAFAAAQIAAYGIAGTGTLFGFVSSMLTLSWIPMAIGSVLSYAMWAAIWPRAGVWRRWTWQAKLRRAEPASRDDATDSVTSTR